MPKTDTEGRLAALRASMTDAGVDLAVLGPGPHMHWVLGWHPHPDERLTLLVVGGDEARFVVPAVNATQAGANAGTPLDRWDDADGPGAALDAALAHFGKVGSVAIDEGMRAEFALEVMDRLPGAARSYAASTVGALRMRKDEAEIAAIRASARIADTAMRAGFAALRPGMTETQAAAFIRRAFEEAGATVAFSLVAGGPNGAHPHHTTGDRMLEVGDAVVMDIGATHGGFPSDMTRMAAIGQVPDGYAEVHAVVEAAVVAAMAAARPGALAREVDRAARDVIAAAGYGEYFVHRTGHGLGLEVHEPPYLTSTSDTVLEEGMVFSIEPGIYLPGRFGIRLEEIVVLRDGGPEILSGLPRELYMAT